MAIAEDKFVNVWKCLQERITEFVTVQPLLPCLIKCGLLNDSEREHIARVKTEKDRSRILFDIISRRGPNSLNRFIDALQEHDQYESHQYLAQLLIEECERVTRVQTCSTLSWPPVPPPRPIEEVTPEMPPLQVEEGVSTLNFCCQKELRNKLNSFLNKKEELESQNTTKAKLTDSSSDIAKALEGIHCTGGQLVNIESDVKDGVEAIENKLKKVDEALISLSQKLRNIQMEIMSQRQKLNLQVDYMEVKVLAHGESGEFCLAVNKTNRSKVVIKKPKSTISQEILEREINVLRCCQHPNIIALISADLNQSKPKQSLYFEYAERGKLQHFLQNEEVNVNYEKLFSMALGVASGMIELGLRRIIHCDLRASSILVDGDMVCKIASFNKAQYLKEHETHKVCDSFQIATRWQAPEVLISRKFSVQSDMWSFGVFLTELFSSGKTPYPGMTTAEVRSFVLDKKRMEKPKEFPKEVYNLMKECFCYNAEQRLTFAAIHKTLKYLLSKIAKIPSDETSSEFEG